MQIRLVAKEDRRRAQEETLQVAQMVGFAPLAQTRLDIISVQDLAAV